MQENIPSLIYTIEYDKNKKIEVIRHPSPTSQEIVSKAILIDEFRGFIRSLKEDFKHLIINFQDRTSWKEFSRCKAIEDMQYRVDFKKKLRVVTLNKDTDFYHQRALFLNLNRADYFISHLKQQLLLEDCGFFIFKSKENREIIEKFIDKMADVIHHNLFNKKNMLTRKERMDFIEIFYQFLILKIIEMTSPASISFMSKDSIDVGSIEAATFYAFIKLLKEVKWDKKSQDFMYWLAYSPALMIRERAVDEQRLSRALSSLSLFDMEMLMHKPKILKAVSTLYDISFLKGLDVID